MAQITAMDMPHLIPGMTLVDSTGHGWKGVDLVGFRYEANDVLLPPIQNYKIIVFRHGATPLHRRCGRYWQSEHLAPGAVSVLTNSVESHWRWTEKVDVSFLYLSPALVAEVAADVYEQDIASVRLHDLLRSEDNVFPSIVTQLEAEAQTTGIGERAYVDCLRYQASIHLLRRYAEVTPRDVSRSGQLTSIQLRRIREYVAIMLEHPIGLNELAAVAGLSVFHFARKFRATLGQPPHQWLLQQRIERAVVLLKRRNAPLKVIAADAGFADQSHMTRIFRRKFGITPGDYRRAMG